MRRYALRVVVTSSRYNNGGKMVAVCLRAIVDKRLTLPKVGVT